MGDLALQLVFALMDQMIGEEEWGANVVQQNERTRLGLSLDVSSMNDMSDLCILGGTG